MEEQTVRASNGGVQAGQQTAEAQPGTPAGPGQGVAGPTPAATTTVPEPRQAFGTAKTESLRDSGSWRVLIPIVIVLFSLALLAIPLVFLIPLLFESLNPSGPTGASGAQLTWVWIVMILLEVAVAAVIIRGLFKAFMTQAGNYHS